MNDKYIYVRLGFEDKVAEGRHRRSRWQPIVIITVDNSCCADSPTSCQGYDCNITQKRESEEKDL